MESPYEVLTSKSPIYSELKCFGCLCYATNVDPQKKKFDKRARRGMFIGYPSGCKGYRIYDINTTSVFVSRDVIFYEDVFPLSQVVDDDNVMLPLPAMDLSTNIPFPAFVSSSRSSYT